MKIRPKHILYMEDDDACAVLLKIKLERKGYKVDIAKDGEIGLIKFKKKSYDIIIIDYNMPKSDGMDVLKRLSLMENTVPIIMLTGAGDEKIAVQAMKLGASEYIVKDAIDKGVRLLPSIIERVFEHKKIEVEKKDIEDKLNLAYKVFNNTTEGIVVTDFKRRIEWINPAFTEITGFKFKDVMGKSPRVMHSNEHNKELYKQVWNKIQHDGFWEGEVWNRKKTGEIYPARISINAIKDESGEIKQYSAMFYNITDQKMVQNKLDHIAHHDHLTDLPNRVLFNDRINMAILHSKRTESNFAVMFLDLDNFKTINDTLGHKIGDEVLKTVAQRIKISIRGEDTVSRYGGDEFIIILANMSEPSNVKKIANKILSSVSKPFHISDNELFITTSIGVSIFPYDGKDPISLIKNADIALYRAKNQGKNNFECYSKLIGKSAKESLILNDNLNKAIKNKEFILYYQPLFSVRTCKIIGMKALVRWDHPSLGIILPSKFISIAEETGLIIKLGEWVIKTAVTETKKWHDKGFKTLRIVICLSVKQFAHKGLIKFIKNVLKKTSFKSSLLEFEIAESTAMRDTNLSVSRLNELKKLGVKLTIDDIGKEGSWLNYIKSFPVDSLKIDKSFLENLSSHKNIVPKAIIDLAKTLNLKVTAEGVEKKAQLDFLSSKHCDEMSGYFFSHPVDKREFSKLLKRKSGDDSK